MPKRSTAILLAACALLPPAMVTAQEVDTGSARVICVTVTGAPAELTTRSLLAGLASGTITLEDVHECGVSSSLPENPKPTGSWVVDSTQNPLTDAIIYYASVEAFGNPDQVFSIVCEEGEARTVLYWDSFMDDRFGIQWRIDDGSARSDGWEFDGQYSLMQGDPAITLSRELLGAESLIVRGTTVLGDTQTVTFPLAGIEDAVWEVRAYCGW